MRNENTRSKTSYLFELVFWEIIACYWYKKSFFICLGSFSYEDSLRILFFLTVGFAAAGCLLDWKHERNEGNLYRNVTGGMGIYLAATYYPLFKRIILPVLITGAVLSAVYALAVFCRRIRNRKRYKTVLCRRILMALRGFRNIVSTAGTVILFGLILVTYWGTGLVSPSVRPASQLDMSSQTISGSMDMLIQLETGRWKTLGPEERLDVLQTVANIEQRFLGIPHEIVVGAEYLGEGNVSQYSDGNHRIVISMECLQKGSAYDNVEALAHEARHCYQHCLVRAYENADDLSKSLRIFKDAEIFREEFADYEDGQDNFDKYYLQECENDAREYAEEAAWEYIRRVYEYCSQNGIAVSPDWGPELYADYY